MVITYFNQLNYLISHYIIKTIALGVQYTHMEVEWVRNMELNRRYGNG